MAPRRPTAWGLPLLCLLAAASAPAALAAGCPPGSAGAAGCVGCPKGKWSPGGLVNTCTACPACYTTTDVNSTSAAACGEHTRMGARHAWSGPCALAPVPLPAAAPARCKPYVQSQGLL